jgi:hypothetical protein
MGDIINKDIIKKDIKSIIKENNSTLVISLNDMIIDELLIHFNGTTNDIKSHLITNSKNNIDISTIIKGDFIKFEDYNLNNIFNNVESKDNKISFDNIFDDSNFNDSKEAFNEKFSDII